MSRFRPKLCALPQFALFPREIFRRDEEDRRRRCRRHRRGGLTKYPAEKIRGTAGVVRELCGLEDLVERNRKGGEKRGAQKLSLAEETLSQETLSGVCQNGDRLRVRIGD